MNIIKKTKNGKIFKCNHCKAIHIEFKNLNFNFGKKQFDDFTRSIEAINGEKYEKMNRNSQFERKIIIPTQQKNLNILLTSQELTELKTLLKKQDKTNNCFTIETNNMLFSYYKNYANNS